MTLLLAFGCALGAPVLLYAWLWCGERLSRALPRRAGRAARPAVWLGPAVALLGVYLLWPLLSTVFLSFRDAAGDRWAGLDNFRYLAGDPEVHDALANNALWLVVLVTACTAVGLVVALLGDRVRYEAAAKAAVIAPLSISFVSGAVIWRSMYDYAPPGLPQTGTLNAVLTALTSAEPIAWLADERTGNPALITVGVWMTAGFATVVLSAAVKGIPAELHEAARVDGASWWQELRHITLPQLRPALLVVSVMVAIAALKAFDIVYVMTNGSYQTNVIANVLYRQLFVNQDYGKASAIALLLVVLAAPVIALNQRVQRAGEAR
ncbi:carbohydrate ABC transporter permease [Acrocarpospora catenulata]|uniref:carbohydrate ABC transporter permease n=1 Tax=Acrocarpospora catenulata TaxID=2836182 RepID=UPI001BD96DF5|nr:sugar ABC transporter permease [Acrocarpospora catenulata]